MTSHYSIRLYLLDDGDGDDFTVQFSLYSVFVGLSNEELKIIL